MTLTAAAVTVAAEVRILDAGGARLTPGMLEQLDAAGWDEITPLGRVRPPGTDPAYTETVGASARGWDRGALVRSVLPVPELAAALADGGPPPARTPPRGATTSSASTRADAMPWPPRAGTGPSCHSSCSPRPHRDRTQRAGQRPQPGRAMAGRLPAAVRRRDRRLRRRQRHPDRRAAAGHGRGGLRRGGRPDDTGR